MLWMWYMLSMDRVSANTSWEHHAFGGPYSILHGSRSAIDFVFAGFVFSSILIPLGAWAWTGHTFPVIVAIFALVLSVLLSICAAASASC